MKKFTASAFLLCLILSSNAFSQSTNATLGGTVQDPSGALIPGVSITATNTQTGIVSTVITNESGAYQFASLQPGIYDVKADLPGFQSAVAKAFQLGGSQQARFNFKLEIGTTTTTIDVTSEAATLLATSSNSVGTVLPESTVRDLPVSTRNIFNLVQTTPGVQSQGGTIGIMAGGRLGDVNATRDGVNVNDGRYENGAWSVVYSSPDLVEEVKIVVAPVDAETSRGSGQVSMVTRSGGNAYRGSAFWVNHNSALDANDWFINQQARTDKSYDNRNQFGARLSGPIIRNKTFFFVLYEGQRDMKRSVVTGTTLTDTAKAGILRYFPGIDNGNANNSNPAVDRNGNPLNPSGATGPLSAIDLFGNCTFQGAPVANCRTFRDPQRSTMSTNSYVLETLKRMPSPNDFTGGDGLNTASILFVRRQEGLDLTNGNGDEVNRDQYNIRIDHTFNSAHKLSLIGTHEKTWGTATQAGLRAWPLGYDGLAVKRPYVYTIQFTSTLSSSMLNQIRLSKRASNNWQWGSADRNDAVGAEARALHPVANGIPFQVAWASGIPNISNIGGFGRWREGINPMRSIADDFSWTRGKHAFKVGFEWRRQESNGFNDPNYDPIVTLGAGSNPITGLDGTAFPGLTANSATLARNLIYDLSGSVASINQAFGVVSATETTLVGTPTIRNNRHWNYQSEISAFFKDDWKFSRGLTLNVGLHWEWYGQPYEHNGLAARIIGDESVFSKVKCTSSPGTANFTSTCTDLVQVQFVGKNSTHPDIGTNLKGNDLNNFGPAVGFSWNLPWFGEDKTVLRSGYGINYSGAARNFINVDSAIGTVPGINLVSGGSGLGYTPATVTTLSTTTLPIPFPTGTPRVSPFIVPTTDRTLAIETYSQVAPYTQNWNIEIQRQVAKNTTIEIRYIGTKGTKLWSDINLNAIDSVGHNKELFDAFNAVRAGGESPLLNQILSGMNFGGGVVNGSTFTGAMSVRTNTTTRAQIANGNVGGFVNTLNTTITGSGSTDTGATLRRNGFAENYIVVSPQYRSVDIKGNNENSTYHAFQAQVTRRLSKGFANTTTWVWSRSLGAAAAIDPSNRNADKALQGADRAHQFTSNGTYELPFGTGHFLLGNAPGWVQQFVEKWQLGGILNFNTGAPLTLTSGLSTIGTTGANVNVVGELPKNMGKVTKVSNGVVYFDGFSQIDDPYKSQVSTLNGLSTAFNNKAILAPDGRLILVNPQPGERGSLGYTTLRGPSNLRFDLNMIKRFRLRETKEIELRVDAINVLNHPNFGNPTTSINGNNTFGRITSATGARSFVVNTRLNF